ncbi:MAG: ribonuclease HI family protein [Candidatus Caldarchaeum sp.]|nr:ribonuclease HI family protein [Candidatus Caldarchaeum sp.]MCX8201670.1 ribonuclease HI family protein [Candidatus Caldarchaeum sp.]MDW8063491.1 ribonuclease HI family protein [Candidatus Caldarchaeum sp.]MDW8434901.1 ribonuclease HI family protein [Candidatus Caldarchaeum sp.]
MPNTAEEAEIYVDGASRGNPGPAGIGYVIKTRDRTFKHHEYIGKTTNNQAEYTALIKALEEAAAIGVKKAKVYSDSALLVKQVKGEFRVRNRRLAELRRMVLDSVSKFEEFDIIHVDREKNREADGLANQAIDSFTP